VTFIRAAVAIDVRGPCSYLQATVRFVTARKSCPPLGPPLYHPAEVAAILVLKLLLTPLLIGGSTLAARRWGPMVGGWIIALPLTSGPILVFLAAGQGPTFAAAAAVGSLAGLAAIAAFCAVYSAAARRVGPATSFAAASPFFFVAGAALQPTLDEPIWLPLAIVIVAVALAARFIPAGGAEHAPLPHPWWDIPARMVVATAVVVGITAIAPFLGPHWSGVVATFPVYLSVLAVFTHRHAGAAAADDVLRGLLGGLYGTAAFFVVVDVGLAPIGLVGTFLVALALTAAIGAIALIRMRPGRQPEPA